MSALGDLISEKKVVVEFLDIATLEEIEKTLKQGEHQVVHFSGHGGHFDWSVQKRGVLYLEDEWGRVKEVTGEELAGVLSKYGSIQLVVLSACETAHAEDYGVAGALIKGGIPAVLGMRYPVSDPVATMFTSWFYKYVCTGVSLNRAMFNARQTIYKYEEERRTAQQKEKEPKIIISEWMTPVLYLNQNTCQLMDYSKTPTDTRYFFQKPVSLVHGGKYVGRGFIGRHKEILNLYRLFREGNRKVCIYGQGGTGKTTLAIRFADNFENSAYQIIQFRDQVSEETILTRLAKEAAPLLGDKIVQMIESPEIGQLDKLDLLMEHFLSRKKIILLFDNFEENQTAAVKGKEKKIYQREIDSPRLKNFLVHLCNGLTTSSYVLFTTRYLFTEPEVAPLNLREMRWSDSFKLINRFEKLVHMPYNEKKQVHRKLGGHPRGFELLESYMSHEKVEWTVIDKKLRQVEDWEINHDLLLDMLWQRLTKDQQTALTAASVFRGLTAPEGLIAVTGQTKEKVMKSIETLNALSLLYLEEEKFYTHRLTATFVQNDKMEKKQIKEFHHKAADYFNVIRDEDGNKILNNDFESRWHYLEAGQWDRAADITFSLGEYLSLHGYLQLSFELLIEVGEKPINDKNRANVYHQMGVLHQDFGEYDEAFKQLQNAKKIMEKIGDIRGVSRILHDMAVQNQEMGNYDAALEQLQREMEIFQENKDLKGVSTCLYNIGRVYLFQGKGNRDKALIKFKESIDIKKKIDDEKGISNNLIAIGNIYHEKGNYDEAINHFQESLEIKMRIGDTIGVSYCLYNIGAIHQTKGDYDEALKQYQQSLEIREKVGGIVELAKIYLPMGTLYLNKGDFFAALTHSINAFLILAKANLPQAQFAVNDIRSVREKMPEAEFAAILKEFGLTPEMFEEKKTGKNGTGQ